MIQEPIPIELVKELNARLEVAEIALSQIRDLLENAQYKALLEQNPALLALVTTPLPGQPIPL